MYVLASDLIYFYFLYFFLTYKRPKRQTSLTVVSVAEEIPTNASSLLSIGFNVSFKIIHKPNNCFSKKNKSEGRAWSGILLLGSLLFVRF
jgi:hypothetical protein